MEKQNKLPEELQNIPPVFSVDECLFITQNILDKNTKINSFKINLAKKYFEKNLDDFTTEQVMTIFKNPFINGFTGDFASRALKYAVKHDMVFPIMFANWFDQVEFSTRKKYLIILNKNNHSEQIKLFCSKDKELKVVNHCLENNIEPSEKLINEAIKFDPSLILYNSLWSKEKISTWFNEHEKDFFSIVKKAQLLGFKTIPKPVKINILNRLADIFIAESDDEEKFNSEENNNFLTYFRYFPLEYISIIENKSPGLIEKILATQLNFQNYTINVAQYFLDSQLYHENGYQNISGICEKYSKLLLCPVKEYIYMYKNEVDVFELALRKNMWSIFTPFSSDMSLLNSAQKEKMLAAAFAYISLEFDAPGKKILDIWARNVFLNIEHDIFTKYYNQYKNENKTLSVNDSKFKLKYYKHSLNTELDKISFQKKLDDNLNSKKTSPSLKI